MPVGDVEDRGQPVAAEPWQVDRAGLRSGPEPSVEGDEEGEHPEKEEEGGQQPPGSPCPERPEPDPRRRRPLLEQEGGDEEAREDEEEVDAEVAPRHPPGATVVGDDRGDR